MELTPQDVLLQEFMSYYNADELGFFIYDGLEEQADESAERMVRILGNRALEVAALMREMAADFTHPVYRTICKETLYEWAADPESWAKFQILAQRISDGITNAINGSGGEAKSQTTNPVQPKN